jgi:hypothetical protein
VLPDSFTLYMEAGLAREYKYINVKYFAHLEETEKNP